MANGQYIALSSALAAAKSLNIVANNLANVNTPGFKQERAAFSSFMVKASEGFAQTKGFGAMSETYNDLRAGALVHTGNPLDIAIDGPGFFSVDDGKGGELLTRSGNLRLATDGTLVDSGGRAVLTGSLPAQPQPVQINQTLGPVAINEQGEIVQGGTVLARLRIVDADPQSLTPVGSTSFSAAANSLRPVDASIRNEHLEQSNVNAVQAMTELIEIQRKNAKAYDIIGRYSKLDSKLMSTV